QPIPTARIIYRGKREKVIVFFQTFACCRSQNHSQSQHGRDGKLPTRPTGCHADTSSLTLTFVAGVVRTVWAICSGPRKGTITTTCSSGQPSRRGRPAESG